MKKFLAIMLMILMLTACSANKPAPKQDPIPAPAPQEQQQAQDETPAEPASGNADVQDTPDAVPFTTETVDGLIEDTVGYSFEIPVFDVPGYEIMRMHYEDLVQDMEGFTKDVVYEKAMERSCGVSVYGKVVTAVMIDDVLFVTYAYECHYNDAEEPEVETRIDRFDPATGEPVE